MSTIREHLGDLWLWRHRMQPRNPLNSREYEVMAAYFVHAHLDELIQLAGGADISNSAREHFPEIPGEFPTTSTTAQAATGETKPCGSDS